MTREEAIKWEDDMDYKDLIERLNNAAGGPAYAKCTVTYRGSACAALRGTYGLDNDPEIITNADRIRAMSDEELGKFRAISGLAIQVNIRVMDVKQNLIAIQATMG